MFLAVLLVVLVSALFALGAAVALVWSFKSGHWDDMPAAAAVVLKEDEPIGWDKRGRV